MSIRYGELPERPRAGVALVCSVGCDHGVDGSSAVRGDYFMANPNERVVCICGAPMVLVQRVMVEREVTPEEAEGS